MWVVEVSISEVDQCLQEFLRGIFQVLYDGAFIPYDKSVTVRALRFSFILKRKAKQKIREAEKQKSREASKTSGKSREAEKQRKAKNTKAGKSCKQILKKETIREAEKQRSKRSGKT